MVAGLVLGGCSGSGGDAVESAPPTGVPTTASAAVQAQLVGEWERTTTCAELVEALTRAGLAGFVLEAVAGNGFVPGVSVPAQVADPQHPCAGAVPRRHSHFFTADGRFGSRDWNGEQVDDGTYEIRGDGAVVISKEFPDVTFRYRIEADTVAFDPVVPEDCLTFRCAWSVSMAYPGETWTRVP